MKKNWTDRLYKKGKCILHTIEQPVVRHHLHYHCGVYKKEGCREPLMAMHVDNDCTVPLVKVLAVVGGVMVAGAAISAVATSISQLCTHKNCEDC